jgi:hypothetical protein
MMQQPGKDLVGFGPDCGEGALAGANMHVFVTMPHKSPKERGGFPA